LISVEFQRPTLATLKPTLSVLVVGERAFPPASGLTYCTWFCVDKFSCADTDAHPVRLLTVCRHLQHRDDNLVCLSVCLSARDRALLISTQELALLASAQGQYLCTLDYFISNTVISALLSAIMRLNYGSCLFICPSHASISQKWKSAE